MNVQVSSDQALLKSYLAGNKSAISQLIERHSSRVRDYIRMMVKDRDVADDILQETFIKAVRVIDAGKYADKGRFLSWIMRIAHNQVIDHYRAGKNARMINESDAGYDVLGTMRYSERTVEEEMIAGQTDALVRELIERLSPEQREVVKLRYYEGLDFKEIAAQTNVGINTALGRMRYALIHLRKMIEENNLVLN
ncbi:MAG: RNA polymerase sigma factor [Alistipes sp.]|nr:RNA polymerase sigma factor [Alistipes sp.]